MCSVSKRSFSVSDFPSGADTEMKYHMSGVSETHILPKELETAVVLLSHKPCSGLHCPRPSAQVLTHYNGIRLGELALFYRWNPEAQRVTSLRPSPPPALKPLMGPHLLQYEFKHFLVRHSRRSMVDPQSITAVCLTVLLHQYHTPAEMIYLLFPYYKHPTSPSTP